MFRLIFLPFTEPRTGIAGCRVTNAYFLQQLIRIIADSEYDNTHLHFIAAVPNPMDSVRAVVIYTAQAVNDIIGVNSVFHGPTDFEVARGKEILKASIVGL